jgi:hypothetical protein
VVFPTPDVAAACVAALDGKCLPNVTQEGQVLIAAAGRTLDQANTNANVHFQFSQMRATGVSVNVVLRVLLLFVCSLRAVSVSVNIESVNE